ncbi:Uma2 family endonuclease [Streptomyces sp. NPDC127108]|uniref:Uma2 family endonuclease n=1 Tax=Streptomyces sp. NPDC127108 TaxID=3345361 RepID=UPI003636181E
MGGTTVTAEPISEAAEPASEPKHQWVMPPVDGWTVDDLRTLPGLPPHTEMIDGSLVFVTPQRAFHNLMIRRLTDGLLASVPPEYDVFNEMTVVIDRKNGPEPDVLVVRGEAFQGLRQTSFDVADVLLAVEVVSPDSESRDRDTKPHKYAAAGIKHYWLAEMEGEDDHSVVRVYELDPVTRKYVGGDSYRDRLKLVAPFSIDIDLTALHKR